MTDHTVTCGRCDRQPERDEHKGDAVLRCPGCDRILVRGALV